MGFIKPQTVVAAAPITVLNRGSFVNIGSSGASTFTATAYPIGTASSTRRVIVGVVTANLNATAVSHLITSATIGGVSATIDVQVSSSSSRQTGVHVISATVPTGTTANIVLNFDNAFGSRVVVGIYGVAIDGLVSTTPVTARTVASSTSPLSTTLATTSGGFLIAGVMSYDGGGISASVAWTGATEQNDQTALASTDFTASFADVGNTATDSALSVSAAITAPGASGVQRKLFAVAYR